MVQHWRFNLSKADNQNQREINTAAKFTCSLCAECCEMKDWDRHPAVSQSTETTLENTWDLRETINPTELRVTSKHNKNTFISSLKTVWKKHPYIKQLVNVWSLGFSPVLCWIRCISLLKTQFKGCGTILQILSLYKKMCFLGIH